MKRTLSHLPKHKREELCYITEFVRSKSKYADMLILFGSYARGDWVEDTYVEDGVTYEYKSDYDILVISENETIAGRYRYWYEIAQKAARGPVKTRITIIAHDIEHINNSLKKGQYFFTDIKKRRHPSLRFGQIQARSARQARPETAKKHGKTILQRMV